MFSKTCEYGIKAVVFIAQKSDDMTRVSLKNTAVAIDSPEAFTAKILQQLVRANIVGSQKGPKGGFFIDKNQATSLTLAQIVTAIDGDGIYKGCGLGLKTCDENHPCPMHDSFVEVRTKLKNMLEETRIKDLVTGLNTHSTFLKT